MFPSIVTPYLTKTLGGMCSRGHGGKFMCQNFVFFGKYRTVSVVIPIIITIIINIGRCLQIYLNVLLWSTSFSIFGKLFICGHFIFLLSSISLSQSTINQTSLQVICFCRTLSKINIIITELRCYIIKLYSSFFCSLASSL